MINVTLQESDLKILLILYKSHWAMVHHIAILMDESEGYIRRRLIQLMKAGLVERTCLRHGMPSVNTITPAGMNALKEAYPDCSLPARRTRKPEMFTFEHDLGLIDIYVFLVIAKTKSGKTLVPDFSHVMTERDISAASSRLAKEKRISSEQPVLSNRTIDSGIHRPDGYYKTPSGSVAIEFERTLKSKTSNTTTREAMLDNSVRFKNQIWFCVSAIKHKLKEYAEGIPGVQIIDYAAVQETINRYRLTLPNNYSKSAGRIPSRLVGSFITPLALTELASIREVQLEDFKTKRPDDSETTGRSFELER